MDDVSRRDKPGDRGAGVGGRLRQRLARMLLHSTCATTSATSFVGLATAPNGAVPRLGAPPRCPTSAVSGRCQRRHRRRGGGRAALVHISIDCSARSVGAAAVLPSPIVPAAKAKQAKAKGKADASSNTGANNTLLRSSTTPLYSGWSSSTDTFSSEEADTTLVSSRGFSSSDSTAASDFYHTANNNGAGSARRRHSHSHRRPSPRPPASAGATAVVKRSVNPYADFRSSMAEMVAGRRVRGADALSELLARYLALNSPRHHPAILAAFEDVWEALVLSG
ncbi:hypothetical protein BS78_09G250800 [Paspalum vaginatum]|nr:hypothetical protein BS78_09G250800 [Paspalum vaginatum]